MVNHLVSLVGGKATSRSDKTPEPQTAPIGHAYGKKATSQTDALLHQTWAKSTPDAKHRPALAGC
jgi:hypothetical protein